MSLPGPKSQVFQIPTHPYFFPVTGKHKEQVEVLNPCSSINPLGFPLQDLPEGGNFEDFSPF